jgi:phage-related baseplate assembly protein
MQVAVISRGGGAMSTARLEALADYISARVRSHLAIDVQNATMTAVEVKATITLRPNFTLRQVFASAAGRITDFLDIRKREFGEDVDEADLLVVVKQTPGVGSLETATFEPAANVEVAADSLPVLTRLWLIDATSGDEINATLTQTY